MRPSSGHRLASAAVLSSLLLAGAPRLRAELPAWAYPVAPALSPVAPEPGAEDRPRTVPGSTLTLTRRQFEAHVLPEPDWHPEEHPPMPPVVRMGREPQVWACAYCHLPNGAGRPENASLAGLSRAYILQQLEEFRAGRRQGSEPRRGPQNAMIAIAKALTRAEAEAAAAYFASLTPATFITVIEQDSVPQTYVAGAMLAVLPGGAAEPLGDRIIEVPESLERAENRDSRTPYLAFVPVGSVRRGEALARRTTAPTNLACGACHGPGLRGQADFPRLAGRSPSYLMRQLYDYRAGTRTGAGGLMQGVTAHLTTADMVDLAAYLASLSP